MAVRPDNAVLVGKRLDQQFGVVQGGHDNRVTPEVGVSGNPAAGADPTVDHPVRGRGRVVDVVASPQIWPVDMTLIMYQKE